MNIFERPGCRDSCEPGVHALINLGDLMAQQIEVPMLQMMVQRDHGSIMALGLTVTVLLQIALENPEWARAIVRSVSRAMQDEASEHSFRSAVRDLSLHLSPV